MYWVLSQGELIANQLLCDTVGCLVFANQGITLWDSRCRALRVHQTFQKSTHKSTGMCTLESYSQCGLHENNPCSGGRCWTSALWVVGSGSDRQYIVHFGIWCLSYPTTSSQQVSVKRRKEVFLTWQGVPFKGRRKQLTLSTSKIKPLMFSHKFHFLVQPDGGLQKCQFTPVQMPSNSQNGVLAGFVKGAHVFTHFETTRVCMNCTDNTVVLCVCRSPNVQVLYLVMKKWWWFCCKKDITCPPAFSWKTWQTPVPLIMMIKFPGCAPNICIKIFHCVSGILPVQSNKTGKAGGFFSHCPVGFEFVIDSSIVVNEA